MWGLRASAAIERTDFGVGKEEVADFDEWSEIFDNLGESKEVTRILYKEAKRMLLHRSGTEYESLVYVHPETVDVLRRDDMHIRKQVEPSKKMKKMVLDNLGAVISIHNHPTSFLPSLSDLRSARRYKYRLIVCHDGSLIKYEVD